ncbi:MAG: PaaI family thioesterase [Desulfarculus sp.]|nr:PaaI family thioesterase [Desulfarculus sp.]
MPEAPPSVGQDLRHAILARITQIPIFSTLGMEGVDFAPGWCRVRIPRQARWDGIFASLHGGILMTLADSTAAFAILTLSGPQAVITTTDMNIRFLAPCLSGATATARVIKAGRSLCPCAVDIHDDEGKLVAVAQVTYMRLGGGEGS